MKTIDSLEFHLWLQSLENIDGIAAETVKIMEDYPEMTIGEAIRTAGEVLND